MVLEQLKQLMYEDADNLVHFHRFASTLQLFTANPAFDLESSLRSFALVMRSKHKLQLISKYLLTNIFSDIGLLTSTNAIVADSEP